ncbi:MAG: hypothetical protein CL484_04585 [Acidobacteria bacterium]|nr:hypothetical protein [Acidobacteriota bacterium]
MVCSTRHSSIRRPFSKRRGTNRRTDPAQPTLPLPPPKRSGATKVRSTNQPRPLGQRLMELLLALMTIILVANGLVGNRGLVQTAKVRQEQQKLISSIERLRKLNRQLAQQVERLRGDPSALEELARRELGLLQPGEQVFIITDRELQKP